MSKTEPPVETTVDGFLNNSFSVIQPANGSHRSGMDAVLLAAAIAEDATGKLADFGAGCGVAGMAVAHRCPNVEVDLLEIDPLSVELTKQSLELQQNAPMRSRLKVLQIDLTLPGKARCAAGLLENHYDHIISNPPYNSNEFQASPNDGRARAHVMNSDLWEAWVRTAASVAKPSGLLTMILRPQSLHDALNVLSGRFGSARILPLYSKPGTEAGKIILRAQKGGKAGLQLLPGIVLHDPQNGFSQEAEEIFRGRASLCL